MNEKRTAHPLGVDGEGDRGGGSPLRQADLELQPRLIVAGNFQQRALEGVGVVVVGDAHRLALLPVEGSGKAGQPILRKLVLQVVEIEVVDIEQMFVRALIPVELLADCDVRVGVAVAYRLTGKVEGEGGALFAEGDVLDDDMLGRMDVKQVGVPDVFAAAVGDDLHV